MTVEDKATLDRLEISYDTSLATVKLYDDSMIHDVHVYVQKDLASLQMGGDSPPSERYISIMVMGCEEHGVHQSHIDYLNSIECVPRTKPEDFIRFSVPDGLPVWTMEQVAEGNCANLSIMVFLFEFIA